MLVLVKLDYQCSRTMSRYKDISYKRYEYYPCTKIYFVISKYDKTNPNHVKIWISSRGLTTLGPRNLKVKPALP